MFCSKCGENNNQDNKFCMNCGNKLITSEDSYSIEKNISPDSIKLESEPIKQKSRNYKKLYYMYLYLYLLQD